MCFQCAPSGLPVVFRCVSIMQITTGLSLGHHWVLASASVVPMASRCTCSSSGPPVCSNYANEFWVVTGRPLGDSINQCGSSVVCPVVTQCTDSIWFGGQPIRSLPSTQPLMYTTGMAGVVWAKLISFELQPQIHKNYNVTHLKSMHSVMLKYSHVWKTELPCITVTCPLAAWCLTILSFQTAMGATCVCVCVCGGGGGGGSSGIPVWGSFNLVFFQWCSTVYPASIHWVIQ